MKVRRRRICQTCRRVIPKHLRFDLFTGKIACPYCGVWEVIHIPTTRVGEWGGD